MSAGLVAGGLLALRLWALLRVQALWQRALGPAWELAAPALALLLVPWMQGAGVAALETISYSELVWLALLEVLLGSVVGLVVSLPGFALLGAARASEVSLLRPAAASRPGALVPLLAACAGAIGLAAGAHRPLLVGLRGTAARFPTGLPEEWAAEIAGPDAITWLAGLGHDFTLLALTLATPVLLASALVATSLRFVGSGPSEAFEPMFALETWLRPAFALVALGAAWAAYPDAWARALG